jgi:hypothetical protein
MEPQRVPAVPGTAKPGTDALDPPRGWAEGSTRTARLVSALATASKWHIAIAPSPLMGRSPCLPPLRRRDTPDAETNDWRAVCGRTARTVVCPVKAGMFSRGQTCRGRSQSPVVWIAEAMETEPSKPIDKTSRGGVTSYRAVTTVNALWPRK